MQTVSPENVLETKPKLEGSDAESGNVQNLDCSRGQADPVTVSCGFENLCAQTSKSHPDFRNALTGAPVYALHGKKLTEGQDCNNRDIAEVGRNSALSVLCSSSEGGKTPQMSRNVRVNIVTPSSSLTQRTPRTVSCVITENPVSSTQMLFHVSAFERSADVGPNILLPVALPVDSMTMENLSLGQKEEVAGSSVKLYQGNVLGSPETRNKRKRYMPFRTPLLDKTNHEEGEDETQSSVSKKPKLECTDLPLGT